MGTNVIKRKPNVGCAEVLDRVKLTYNVPNAKQQGIKTNAPHI
jgi:hypothetical protein